MFNDYEIYMLSKLKQDEMNDLHPLQISLFKNKRNNSSDIDSKSIDITCCQTVCC